MKAGRGSNLAGVLRKGNLHHAKVNYQVGQRQNSTNPWSVEGKGKVVKLSGG